MENLYRYVLFAPQAMICKRRAQWIKPTPLGICNFQAPSQSLCLYLQLEEIMLVSMP